MGRQGLGGRLSAVETFWHQGAFLVEVEIFDAVVDARVSVFSMCWSLKHETRTGLPMHLIDSAGALLSSHTRLPENREIDIPGFSLWRFRTEAVPGHP